MWFTYWSTLPRALGENSCIAIPIVPYRSLPRINHCITISHSLHLSMLVPHIHFMPHLNLYKLTYFTYKTLLKTPGTEGRQLRLSRAPSRTSILRSVLISLHFINTYWDPCLRSKILLSPTLYICKFNLVKGNYWEYSVGVMHSIPWNMNPYEYGREN